MDTNQVIIAGRLTRDPELTFTASNMPICKFGIAVNGMKKEDVSFLDIVAFGKTAESCAKYLHKGSQAIVSGSIKQSRWTAKDGSKRSSVGITANQVQFIGGKREEGQPAAQPERPDPATYPDGLDITDAELAGGLSEDENPF